MKNFGFLFFFIILVSLADGGPAAYAACQTGCNAVATACYAASLIKRKLINHQ